MSLKPKGFTDDLMTTKDIQFITESFNTHLESLKQQTNMVNDYIISLEEDINRINHQLERPCCLYNERAKLATELQKIRIERRKCKDWMIIMKPITEFMSSEKFKHLRNNSSNYLGIVRRVHKNQINWDIRKD